MEKDQNLNADTISATGTGGEKIIFDLVINEKLAHVIVLKNGGDFHINLNAEDLGRFNIAEGGSINRFPQPKGAIHNPKEYFDAVEDKLRSLGKLS